MTAKTWGIFIAICVLLIGGLVWMSRGSRIDVSGVNQHQAQSGSEASGEIADWTKGSDDPKVVIVEYADFQCPGCRSAAPVLNEVVDKYGEHVQLIYRHFPLTNIHPHARAAAAAAESAGKQGKFWEMHDLLFENQSEWSNASGTTRTDIFASYADRLDLDREQFIFGLTASEVTSKINYDTALGRELGVNSTPTIYIDGEKVEQYYRGDEIVSQGTEGAAQIWTNAEAMGKLLIEPKLREAGVDLDNE